MTQVVVDDAAQVVWFTESVAKPEEQDLYALDLTATGTTPVAVVRGTAVGRSVSKIEYRESSFLASDRPQVQALVIDLGGKTPALKSDAGILASREDQEKVHDRALRKLRFTAQEETLVAALAARARTARSSRRRPDRRSPRATTVVPEAQKHGTCDDASPSGPCWPRCRRAGNALLGGRDVVHLRRRLLHRARSL